MTLPTRQPRFEHVHYCCAPGCAAAIALVTPGRSHVLPPGWGPVSRVGTAMLCPLHFDENVFADAVDRDDE